MVRKPDSGTESRAALVSTGPALIVQLELFDRSLDVHLLVHACNIASWNFLLLNNLFVKFEPSDPLTP